MNTGGGVNYRNYASLGFPPFDAQPFLSRATSDSNAGDALTIGINERVTTLLHLIQFAVFVAFYTCLEVYQSRIE